MNTWKDERETLRALNRASDMREVMRIALGYLHERWGVEGLGLQIFDPELQCLLSVRLVDVDATRETRLLALQTAVPLEVAASRSAWVARERQRYHAVVSAGDRHDFVSETDRSVTEALGIKENLMLPVSGGERVIGVLHAGSYSRHMYLDEAACDEIEQFLGNLTGYVIATQAQEMLNREHQRVQETVDLIRQLSATLDLDEVLDLLGRQLRLWDVLDGYCVNLLDPVSERLRMTRVHMPPGYEGVVRTYEHYSFRADEDDPNMLALTQGESFSLDERSIHRFADSSRVRFERWDMRHLVVLPLATADESPFGTLMLFSQSGQLPASMVEVVKDRLHLFAKPLRNALAHRSYQDREAEMLDASERQRAFLDFLVNLGEVHRRDDLYQACLSGLLNCFPQYDFAALYLRDGERLRMRHFHVSRPEDEDVRAAVDRLVESHAFEIRQEDGATPTCFIQNDMLFFEDVPAIRHLPMSAKDRDYLVANKRTKSLAFFPVRDRGEPVGVLWMGSLSRHVTFEQSEHRAIALVATYLGTPLRTVAMVEQIDDQRRQIQRLNDRLTGRVDELNVLVTRDALTGLNNIRDLEGRIRDFMQAVDQGLDSRGFCLLMLDIDHFKLVNDEHGHLVGDEVLREIGARLRQYARRDDLVYRYGGEEFVALLPATSPDEAEIAAERLREVIAGRPIAVDGRDYHVTASFGLTCYGGQGSAKALIDKADQALYAAKRAGRNRVASTFSD